MAKANAIRNRSRITTTVTVNDVSKATVEQFKKKIAIEARNKKMPIPSISAYVRHWMEQLVEGEK
jgi:hypothetical protein